MLKLTKDDIEEARDIIYYGDPQAAGYRVMIKPIDAVIGLEKSEKAQYKTLADKGFEVKTDEQKKRESKGTHHGIVVHVGAHAFQAEELGKEPWVKEGDIVIFDRYAGVEIELPPGSKDYYRFTNDESILGRMEKTNAR